MDSGILVTSMAIGAAIFAGLIIFWFFHSFIKRSLGTDQSVQLLNRSQRINAEEMRRHPDCRYPGRRQWKYATGRSRSA